jgi:hypothetical protein
MPPGITNLFAMFRRDRLAKTCLGFAARLFGEV